jgi:hypothetical protein
VEQPALPARSLHERPPRRAGPGRRSSRARSTWNPERASMRHGTRNSLSDSPSFHVEHSSASQPGTPAPAPHPRLYVRSTWNTVQWATRSRRTPDRLRRSGPSEVDRGLFGERAQPFGDRRAGAQTSGDREAGGRSDIRKNEGAVKHRGGCRGRPTSGDRVRALRRQRAGGGSDVRGQGDRAGGRSDSGAGVGSRHRGQGIGRMRRRPGTGDRTDAQTSGYSE